MFKMGLWRFQRYKVKCTKCSSLIKTPCHIWAVVVARSAGNEFTPVSLAPSGANSLNHLCKLLPKYGRSRLSYEHCVQLSSGKRHGMNWTNQLSSLAGCTLIAFLLQMKPLWRVKTLTIAKLPLIVL